MYPISTIYSILGDKWGVNCTILHFCRKEAGRIILNSCIDIEEKKLNFILVEHCLFKDGCF